VEFVDIVDEHKKFEVAFVVDDTFVVVSFVVVEEYM